MDVVQYAEQDPFFSCSRRAPLRPSPPQHRCLSELSAAATKGIVTTDPNLMSCATAPYGNTGPQRYSTVPLFSGLAPGVNAGLVSTHPDFLGGTTRFINYALLNGDPGKPLYVGKAADCNQGFVTNDPNFRGCETAFIGYANP